jgi:carbamate kinase
LLVVALGGNAISPPAGDLSYAAERRAIEQSARELAQLAALGYRLLLVHGNGPQVGRLLPADFKLTDLDIHVAQTQGELGYLLAAALEIASRERTVALLTRAQVQRDDPAFGEPDKAVGPVLRERPDGDAVWLPEPGGWRRLVASPRPRGVPELPVIGQLLADTHVIAGGGGGVPVDDQGKPCQAVVDKDRLAALLACALDAQGLIFGTDVEGAFRDFGSPAAKLLRTLSPDQARDLLRAGVFAAGSMAPKVESAVDFVGASGCPASIARLGSLIDALDGRAGTRIAASV